MPGMRPKKEGMREKNDSLVIVKADGGLVEADNVYQEFGELHSDKDGATVDVQHKIPVFEPAVVGRPPIQKRTIYYIDEEPQDAGFDPFYMFGTLKSVYNLSASGDTMDADVERKHKRTMDMIFTIFGAFLLVFAFFLAPLIGFSLKTTGDAEPDPSNPPSPSSPSSPNTPAEGAFPTPTPQSSLYWEEIGRSVRL